jgi:MutS domain V
MTQRAEPRAVYQERCRRLAAERDEAARRSRVASTLRLVAFLAAVGLGVLWEVRGGALAVAGTLVSAASFVGLVVWHGRVRRAERWYETLRTLNEEGLHRLDRAWAALPARPAPDPIGGHAYAEDADVFGTPALAQLLGPAGTPAGRRTLADWLLSPADVAEVAARQPAVAELAPLLDLRDEVAAHGRASGEVAAADIARFLEWAEDGSSGHVTPALRVFAWVVPACTVTLLAAHIAGWIDRAWWLLPVAVAAAVTFGAGRAMDRTLRRAFGREGMFTAYPELLAAVCSAPLHAPRLRRLQAALTADGLRADRLVHRLRQLMHLADIRQSGSLYVPIQLLTLWDVHVLAAVERWRRAAGPHVRGWLSAVGEFEALAALATLAHDEPEWCFPEITDGQEARLEASGLAHPMLPPGRVPNDVGIGPPGTFLLVTGSNMSGKSTLLRALATNVVLGLAGGPVCARALRMPVLSLQTSIRVTDSVVRGVSYFMAQLQRMKQVVQAAEAAAVGEVRVLFLLDEILQGTNSAERRIAATRVIRHLVDTGALGAVTTHDLELASEPALTDDLVAVHFTETVRGEGAGAVMSFDYRLRPGVATSTNALALLRMVGLDAAGARAD